MNLPDPARGFPYLGLDTETTGLSWRDRAVGLSWALPDGTTGYPSWGHGAETGNQVPPLPDGLVRWLGDLAREGVGLAWHHAHFDLRMLSYGLLARDDWSLGDVLDLWRRANLHDTQFIACLLNEEEKMSLEATSHRYLPEGDAKLTDEADLWTWLAEQYGGAPTRKSQGKHLSQAPASLVGPYAERDALATLRLLEATLPLLTDEGLEGVYRLERSLIHVSLGMHLQGVRVDLDAARDLQRDIERELDELSARWDDQTGGVNVNSTHQLYEFFQHQVTSGALDWSDHRRAPRWGEFDEADHRPDELRGLDALISWTAKGNPSLTQEILENRLPPNRFTDDLLRMRKLKHYGGTFIDSYLLGSPNRQGDVLHPLFHQMKTSYGGTRSGRYSSSDPNAQNIPSRDRVWAPKIRGLFVPWGEGWRWSCLDYSQIEYRFLAHYSELELRRRGCSSPIAEAYREDPDTDFHQRAADVAGIDRKPAKNVNFATVYGAGDTKLARMLGVSVQEASRVRHRYHADVPEISMMYDLADRRANQRGWIRSWGGRKHHFRPDPNGRGHWYTYRALNRLLQGSAADLLKRAMLQLDEVGCLTRDDTLLHLTVHDELDFSVREEALPEVLPLLFRHMREVVPDGEGGRSHVLSSGVPVRVDVEEGTSWGDVGEWDPDQRVPCKQTSNGGTTDRPGA